MFNLMPTSAFSPVPRRPVGERGMTTSHSEEVAAFLSRTLLHQNHPRGAADVMLCGHIAPGRDSFCLTLQDLLPAGGVAFPRPPGTAVTCVRVVVPVSESIPVAWAVGVDRQAWLWPLLKLETAYLPVVGFVDLPAGPDSARILTDPSWLNTIDLGTGGWWPLGFPGVDGGRVALLSLTSDRPSTGTLWLGWDLPAHLAVAQLLLFGRRALECLPALTTGVLAQFQRTSADEA